MKNKGTFPKKQAEKNQYYNRVIPYLNTNKARLGVSTDNITFILAWILVWNDVYPKAVDPVLTTKPLRDQKDDMIIEIEDKLRGIYDDIPASALTDTDRLTLNLPKRDTVITDRPKIDVTPFLKATGSSGGILDFTTRTDTDSTRPSILEAADGLELVYNIGPEAPATPADCTKTYFSSKAKFKIGMNIGDAGKKVQGFGYWKNNSDPGKSGPPIRFSVMITE